MSEEKAKTEKTEEVKQPGEVSEAMAVLGAGGPDVAAAGAAGAAGAAEATFAVGWSTGCWRGSSMNRVSGTAEERFGAGGSWAGEATGAAGALAAGAAAGACEAMFPRAGFNCTESWGTVAAGRSAALRVPTTGAWVA